MIKLRVPLLAATLLAVLQAPAQAAPVANAIATWCNQQWSGDRALQNFCIKENRNYYDWVQYLRKRTFSDKGALAELDQCIAKHHPYYRAVYDCIQDDGGLFSFLK